MNGEKSENSVLLLKRYCSYQERTIQDVKKYAKKLNITGNNLNSALKLLISEKFIDEQRYADAYVRGKLSNNKWGRLKIRAELVSKQILPEYIQSALNLIPEEEYLLVLEKILNSKLHTITEKDSFLIQKKLINYGISKGFEYELIKKTIEKITKTIIEHET